jgi:hypothetical protein
VSAALDGDTANGVFNFSAVFQFNVALEVLIQRLQWIAQYGNALPQLVRTGVGKRAAI